MTDSVTTVIDFSDKILDILTVKWGHSEYQLVEYNADSPGIHSLVVLLPTDYLWTHVEWRADNGLIVWIRMLLFEFRQSEIRDFNQEICVFKVNLF